MLAPGTGEAVQPRTHGLALFVYTLAKVLIPLLLPWIFRFLTFSRELHLPEERSTVAAFTAWRSGTVGYRRWGPFPEEAAQVEPSGYLFL